MWWLSEEAGPDEDLGPFLKIWEEACDTAKIYPPHYKGQINGESRDCRAIDCTECDLHDNDLECPAGVAYIALAEAWDWTKGEVKKRNERDQLLP